MTFARSLLIVATCLAVLLAAPAACVAAACIDTADSCCVTGTHGDGPQAVVKPLASTPPPVDAIPSAFAWDTMAVASTPVSAEAALSSVVPLRI